MSRDDWVTLSAVLQAVAATLIVVLTAVLAKIAADALGESARQRDVATKALAAAAKQAESADKAVAEASKQTELSTKAVEAATLANAEARRQRHLAAVPMLQVAYYGASATDSTLQASFAIKNISATPALQVQVLVYAMSDTHVATESELARSRVFPVLGPDHEQRMLVDMWNVKNIPTPGAPPSPPEARFSYNWMRVNVEARGLLGARVVQRYDWPANYPSEPWDLREVEIRPDPEDKAWVQRLS